MRLGKSGFYYSVKGVMEITEGTLKELSSS